MIIILIISLIFIVPIKGFVAIAKNATSGKMGYLFALGFH